MLGSHSLIPKQAFLFFPSQQQQYQIRNNRVYRIIFDGDVIYTSFQKEKLLQLHQQLKKQGKNNHLSFISQPNLLRFLQATKYDVQDCVKELKKYKKMQDSILPLRLKPQIQTLLNKGLFYLVGRDINYRPIIVVNVPKIIELDLKEKIFCEVAGYFFTYIQENCMLEGQVQTWITIVDLGKIGLFSLGGTVIDIITFLSRNFKCRLHYSYLINCPGSIKFLFGMAKKAMTQDQINKIHLQQQSQLPMQAFSTIFQEEIEKKYGGYREDITDFWPIKITHTRRPNSYQRTRLISIKQYGQMHRMGLLKSKKINQMLLDQAQAILKKQEEVKRQKKLQQQSQTENLLKTEDSPNIEQEIDIKYQDYQQDSPPKIPQIPLPIDITQLYF